MNGSRMTEDRECELHGDALRGPLVGEARSCKGHKPVLSRCDPLPERATGMWVFLFLCNLSATDTIPGKKMSSRRFDTQGIYMPGQEVADPGHRRPRCADLPDFLLRIPKFRTCRKPLCLKEPGNILHPYHESYDRCLRRKGSCSRGRHRWRWDCLRTGGGDLCSAGDHQDGG